MLWQASGQNVQHDETGDNNDGIIVIKLYTGQNRNLIFYSQTDP